MENWHVTQADLKAVHVCFNHKSPEGRIKRWVTLPDGRTFEAFVYGDRRFLPTVSKLAISGISLGEKFAVSEKPYRIVGPLPDGKLLIQYAGSDFIIDQDSGLKAIDRRIRKPIFCLCERDDFRRLWLPRVWGEPTCFMPNTNSLRLP